MEGTRGQRKKKVAERRNERERQKEREGRE